MIYQIQWRIQDFPEEGAPTPHGGTPTYDFAKKFPKTAWNWKNLDRGATPSRPALDPPLKS